MNDTRCCGSGVCIINADGICWCGQKWDGTKLLKPQSTENEPNTHKNPENPENKNKLPD